MKKQLGAFVGKQIEVLCDGVDFDKNLFEGRAYFNAPEIDGKIFFMSTKPLKIGDYVMVRVNDSIDYDLLGELEEWIHQIN